MCFADVASVFHSVERDRLWQIMAADGISSKLLRFSKAYYTSPEIKARAKGVANCLLKFTLAFDKDVHPRLPFSTTVSTEFFVKPCIFTHGFRAARTSTYLTSLIPTISCY